MNRHCGKKYPRTVDSKNTYLRIRAPEHLDVALEGLIRKVLKEQPHMDDIYTFAADYFDTLLKIREASGIKKYAIQDICPFHNDEDAHEMFKLASTFTKRKEFKTRSKTYKTLSLKESDYEKNLKNTGKTKSEDLNAKSEIDQSNLKKKINEPESEIEEMVISDSKINNVNPDLALVRIPSKIQDEVVVETKEVMRNGSGDEESPRQKIDTQLPEDVNEIKDKIRRVENEIKMLEDGKEKAKAAEKVSENGETEEKENKVLDQVSIEDKKEVLDSTINTDDTPKKHNHDIQGGEPSEGSGNAAAGAIIGTGIAAGLVSSLIPLYENKPEVNETPVPATVGVMVSAADTDVSKVGDKDDAEPESSAENAKSQVNEGNTVVETANEDHNQLTEPEVKKSDLAETVSNMEPPESTAVKDLEDESGSIQTPDMNLKSDENQSSSLIVLSKGEVPDPLVEKINDVTSPPADAKEEELDLQDTEETKIESANVGEAEPADDPQPKDTAAKKDELIESEAVETEVRSKDIDGTNIQADTQSDTAADQQSALDGKTDSNKENDCKNELLAAEAEAKDREPDSDSAEKGISDIVPETGSPEEAAEVKDDTKEDGEVPVEFNDTKTPVKICSDDVIDHKDPETQSSKVAEPTEQPEDTKTESNELAEAKETADENHDLMNTPETHSSQGMTQLEVSEDDSDMKDKSEDIKSDLKETADGKTEEASKPEEVEVSDDAADGKLEPEDSADTKVVTETSFTDTTPRAEVEDVKTDAPVDVKSNELTDLTDTVVPQSHPDKPDNVEDMSGEMKTESDDIVDKSDVTNGAKTEKNVSDSTTEKKDIKDGELESEDKGDQIDEKDEENDETKVETGDAPDKKALEDSKTVNDIAPGEDLDPFLQKDGEDEGKINEAVSDVKDEGLKSEETKGSSRDGDNSESGVTADAGEERVEVIEPEFVAVRVKRLAAEPYETEAEGDINEKDETIAGEDEEPLTKPENNVEDIADGEDVAAEETLNDKTEEKAEENAVIEADEAEKDGEKLLTEELKKEKEAEDGSSEEAPAKDNVVLKGSDNAIENGINTEFTEGIPEENDRTEDKSSAEADQVDPAEEASGDGKHLRREDLFGEEIEDQQTVAREEPAEEMSEDLETSVEENKIVTAKPEEGSVAIEPLQEFKNEELIRKEDAAESKLESESKATEDSEVVAESSNEKDVNKEEEPVSETEHSDVKDSIEVNEVDDAAGTVEDGETKVTEKDKSQESTIPEVLLKAGSCVAGDEDDDTVVVEAENAVQLREEKEHELMGNEATRSETEGDEFLQKEKEALEREDSEVPTEEKLQQEEEEPEKLSTIEEENAEGVDLGGINSKDIAVGAISALGGISALDAVAQCLEKSGDDEKEGNGTEEELQLENPVALVARFLDHERQYSYIERGVLLEDALPEIENEDAVKSQALIESMKVGELDAAQEDSSGPDDDDDDKDGSTTSDEIEFDLSPMKDPETMINRFAGSVDIGDTPLMKDRINIAIISKEATLDIREQFEEIENSQMQFLEVPEPEIGEYYAGNREMQPVNECDNVGNEIIQTGRMNGDEEDENILEVQLVTTIETEISESDSIIIEMNSEIDPRFEVSIETKVESNGEEERRRETAATVIQREYRRFRKRKRNGEEIINYESITVYQRSTSSDALQDLPSDLKEVTSVESDSSFSSSATKINKSDFGRRSLIRSTTRTLLETRSLDPVKKSATFRTRSLTGVPGDDDSDLGVWHQLAKELEEAATKIQSNYRGYKTRKRLQRENAVQITLTSSQDSTKLSEMSTGEFHDTIVLPMLPK